MLLFHIIKNRNTEARNLPTQNDPKYVKLNTKKNIPKSNVGFLQLVLYIKQLFISEHFIIIYLWILMLLEY
jgi:hypothetical protein